MLNTSMQASEQVVLIVTKSCADTAAATSAWVEVPVDWEGDVQIVCAIGAVTGSIAGVVTTADAVGGTGARTVTFSDGTQAFTTRTDTTHVDAKYVDRKALGTHIKYTGTIVTGPVLLGAFMQCVPKYA